MGAGAPVEGPLLAPITGYCAQGVVAGAFTLTPLLRTAPLAAPKIQPSWPATLMV
jgi:hypothetical protein